MLLFGMFMGPAGNAAAATKNRRSPARHLNSENSTTTTLFAHPRLRVARPDIFFRPASHADLAQSARHPWPGIASPYVRGFPQPKDPMPVMPRAFTANTVTMIRILRKFVPNCPAPTENFLITREPYCVSNAGSSAVPFGVSRHDLARNGIFWPWYGNNFHLDLNSPFAGSAC
jgi:hypothetical protein